MPADKPSRDRLHRGADWPPPAPRRRPPWIKVRPAGGPAYEKLRRLLRAARLSTVCEEAHCPNLGECWNASTATFLILGDICTRACGFCAIRTGRPAPPDESEPERVALAVRSLGLRHVVITSVDRDDLPDGGARMFADVVERIRQIQPGCTVEVLIPDFKGRRDVLNIVAAVRPEILGHNIETVPRLFRTVKPQSRYAWSRDTLIYAGELAPQSLIKSGLMVGLGETLDEVFETLSELRMWGVDIVTIGQYLSPSRYHLPVDRYYTPEEFEEIRAFAQNELGFAWVECGPLVRSSYNSAKQARILRGI